MLTYRQYGEKVRSIMKTTAKNLKELNRTLKRNGETNTIRYAGYFMLTMNGMVRAYHWENESGCILGDDFEIIFNCDEEGDWNDF